MITAQILIKNNENIIKQTLESLKGFNIQVADTGCTDKTTTICKEYGYTPLKVSSDDRSKVRNLLTERSKTEWQIYLEPGEFILDGEIPDLTNNSYIISILQNDIITKQIRLWKKGMKFINPVYEKVLDDNAEVLPITLYHEEIDQPDLSKWTDPLAIEPYYYKALASLKQKKYKEFITYADYYLFNNKFSISATMTKYYLGLVYLMINDLEKALHNAILCLCDNVLMAEFWCLVGDIHYHVHEFPKAIVFYENAITLGNRRLKSDKWPIHIPKYELYPKYMIEKCQEIISKVSKEHLVH